MTSSIPTPNATEQSDNSNIQVILTTTTPSLSGACDLKYQLGLCIKSNLHLRIHFSSGNGYYSRNWVSLDTLWRCLSDWEHGTITALALFSLWPFRSINTAGYILRSLIDLGLLTPSTEKPRHWNLVSENQYQSIMTDLKASHSSTPKGKAKART